MVLGYLTGHFNEYSVVATLLADKGIGVKWTVFTKRNDEGKLVVNDEIVQGCRRFISPAIASDKGHHDGLQALFNDQVDKLQGLSQSAYQKEMQAAKFLAESFDLDPKQKPGCKRLL